MVRSHNSHALYFKQNTYVYSSASSNKKYSGEENVLGNFANYCFKACTGCVSLISKNDVDYHWR